MQISISRTRRFLICLGLCFIVGQTEAYSADIHNLGVTAGNDVSLARGVSSDGVVTGSSFGGPTSEAFRWSGSVMSGLGLLPFGTYSDAYGISADGKRIAGTADSSNGTLPRAFLWNGGYQVIDPLPDGTYTAGYGISGDGNFVVGESDSTGGITQAFRWSSGGIDALGVLPEQTSSTALGVSFDGSVVVGVSGTFGFRWESGTGNMSSLGLLSGGAYSVASGTSADGSIVVGYADGNDGNARAFRWESGVMSELGTLPGDSQSVAHAISPDGYLIVGYSDDEAFVWRSGFGMQKLQDVLTDAGAIGIEDWTSLGEAYAVSGNSIDGYSIVGYGYVGSDQRAFLATGLFAVPECSSYVMTALASVTVMILARYGNRSIVGQCRWCCNSRGLQ